MSWEKLQTKKSNKTETTDIDKVFASVFNQPDGKKVLEYLESLTIKAFCSPQMNDQTLWHLEGQRWIVGLIKSKSKRGTVNE